MLDPSSLQARLLLLEHVLDTAIWFALVIRCLAISLDSSFSDPQHLVVLTHYPCHYCGQSACQSLPPLLGFLHLPGPGPQISTQALPVAVTP